MMGNLPVFLPFSFALRNMRLRIWRTLLTLLGIILGVAVVLAVHITNQSTLDSIYKVFDRAAGKANLLVIPVGGGGESLEESLLAHVKRAEGVEVAAPSVWANTILASEAESWELNFSVTGVGVGNYLRLYGVDFALDPQVRVYEIEEGELPAPRKREVLLSSEYAEEKELSLGDELVILTPTGSEHLKVVGLLSDEGVGLLNGGAVAFAPLQIVQDMFGRGRKLDEIAIRTTNEISTSPRLLADFKQTMEKRIGRKGRVIYPAARGQLLAQMLATYQQGLSFFSVIAIFVGAFLIYNAFSMTMAERKREMGMLRAIGMSRWQVFRMVLAEAALLSVWGSALGVGVGVLLARGLTVLVGSVVAVGEQAFTVGWGGIVQSLGVGVVVTLGAALFPAVQAMRTSPLEALRVRSQAGMKVHPLVWISGLVLIGLGWGLLYWQEGRPEARFYRGSLAIQMIMLGAALTVPLVVAVLERVTRPLIAALYGNEGGIGSSNVRRSLGRTTLTVAALMVALAMIIGVGSVSYSFEQDMSSWIEVALGGDLYVRSPLIMRRSFALRLRAVPGVAAVTPARYLTVRVAPSSMPPGSQEDDNLIFYVIDPQTYRQVGEMEFAVGQGDPEANWARLARGNAVFISTVVADRFHLQKGDRINLITHRGERPFTVAAVVVDFTGQGYTITGTYDDMRRWFSESGVDRFTIKVSSGYSVEAVAEEIEDRYKSRENIVVQTTEAMKTSIHQLVEQSFQLFDVLNLIGVIIGALGVINTLTMNVMERQREIGSLRSLGMTRPQVLRMVLAESLAMGAMGGIYGLSFGYVMAKLLIFGMNAMNGYELDYLFSLQPFLIGALIALAVSQLAALFPARRAAWVNIVEAIQHE